MAIEQPYVEYSGPKDKPMPIPDAPVTRGRMGKVNKELLALEERAMSAAEQLDEVVAFAGEMRREIDRIRLGETDPKRLLQVSHWQDEVHTVMSKFAMHLDHAADLYHELYKIS